MPGRFTTPPLRRPCFRSGSRSPRVAWDRSSTGSLHPTSCEAAHRAGAPLCAPAMTVRDDGPLHGLDPERAVFTSGRVSIGGASEALSEIVARNHPEGVETQGEIVGMGDDPHYNA